MKTKWLIPIMCILMAGCSENMTPTASLLSGSNIQLEENSVEYVGRLGLQADGINFGLQSTWADEAEDMAQFYGVFITQELTNDPNLPVLGKMYLGAQATINLDNDGGLYGPILGTSIEVGGIEVITEFQYRHFNEALAALNGQQEDKYRLIIGPKFKF